MTSSTPRAFHLPELLKLFAEAPTFVARKPQKAVRLSTGGELMVESTLAEHMAAGLAPTTTPVVAGTFAVFGAEQADKVVPLLNDDGTITPEALLDNHIEVMDVVSEDDLTEMAITTGEVGDLTTDVYLDAPIKTTIAPEAMTIQAFGSETGIEVVQKGQILIKSEVLGVLPYERPHYSLTQDVDFLNQHVAVNGQSVTALAVSSAHTAFAHALSVALDERQSTTAQVKVS